MNLRTRFTILIFGAIFIPMCVMVVAFLIFNNYMSVTDPVWGAKFFHDQIKDLGSLEEFHEITDKLGDSYFSMMIESPDLLYTSDPDILSYSKGDGKENASPRMIISSQKKTLDNGNEVLIVFGLNLFDVNSRLFPMLFMFSMTAALIILSLLTIRSINKSITKLERATGKIAEGDLEVNIDTSGKDKFGSLARSLDTMRHQIKMEYDRRNRFFMGVSHDLKTPLASITGYADALCEGMADDKEAAEKYLRIIQDKSRLLENRISHLIHYLKLSNYDFQASLELKSLTGFLKEFCEVQTEEAEFHGREFQWEVSLSSDLSVEFDEELLFRALENLIQNGFRYSDEATPVRLVCRRLSHSLEIIIENRGTPIPEEQLPLLFEPFFRGDKARKGDGFGLGLSSVKSIMDSHGWSIDVKSGQEKTSFTITLPL